MDAGLDHPEVSLNSAYDILDNALGGRLVKSVAGNANVTLVNTPTDEARYTRFEFTGALTGNIAVLFPVPGGTPAGNSSRRFTVYNSTSGSFTLTIKTTAGSTGVKVPQGWTMLLEHDGTNVYPVSPAIAASGLFVPMCRVNHNAAQSIANASNVVLAMNSEYFDTDQMHDTVTTNSRITIQTAGKYVFFAAVAFDINATGNRGLHFLLNGATIIAIHRQAAISGDNTYMSLASIPYNFAAGNYVELVAYQSSGGALNVLSSASFSPEFGCVRVD